jgi:hypothetical protein
MADRGCVVGYTEVIQLLKPSSSGLPVIQEQPGQSSWTARLYVQVDCFQWLTLRANTSRQRLGFQECNALAVQCRGFVRYKSR